ncbi:putative serpin-Z5 [Oryza sativa Japonica Group]|nr:putative serpin-Z5 [Oryza sativa Japonica Group]
MASKTKASKRSRHDHGFAAVARPPSCPGLTELAIRLARRIPASAAGGGGNLVFSPLSVYAALALVAAGAAGDTLAELLGVLGVASYDELAGLVGRLAGKALADLSGTGGPCVSFVSAVWHDMARTLAPSFRAAAVLSFMAETHAVDMRSRREAVGQINAWAKKATNELIDSVIDGELPADADVVVTNAVYFKGKWEEPFKKRLTITDKFHRLGAAAAVDARFMRSTLPRHHIACHDGFKVLRLPYEQGRRPPWSPPPSRFSMCVFLPDARDGLWDLLDEIASAPGLLQAALPTKTVRVGKFMLPKFKLTFSDDIAGVLRGLGLDVTFSDGVADFSKMVEDDGGRRPLSMRSLVHKAVIEVNEEGTEAAAVTGATLCLASAKRPRPVVVDFVADHPFAFFVIEETSGAVVFAGHVLDPSSKPGALDDDDDDDVVDHRSTPGASEEEDDGDDDMDYHVGMIGCLRQLWGCCCMPFVVVRNFVKFLV